jgi:hypothetical protein
MRYIMKIDTVSSVGNDIDVIYDTVKFKVRTCRMRGVGSIWSILFAVSLPGYDELEHDTNPHGRVRR